MRTEIMEHQFDVVIKSKTCRKCKEEKAIDQFCRTKSSKDGINSICKKCVRVYKCFYRNKNKEVLVYKNYINKLKREYNIDIHIYNSMKSLQNAVCAICKKEETAKYTSSRKIDLLVDHSHATNKVRGLLCRKCNFMLGFCNDDISILENAINYLKKYQE